MTLMVPKYFLMDPEFETLYPSGEKLANGMKILIADPDKRVNIDVDDRKLPSWEMDRALRHNRWMTVTGVSLGTSYADNTHPVVRFVGVYEDGTQYNHEWSTTHSWLVKKDSIPETPENDLRRRSAVQAEVMLAITRAVAVNESGLNTDEKAEEIVAIVQKSTGKILGVL